MKQKRNPETTASRPEKVLLHMAQKDGDWAGKAVSFRNKKQFKFDSLRELFEWLKEALHKR